MMKQRTGPAASIVVDDPLSWRETRALLAADHARLQALARPHQRDGLLWCGPSMIAVALHRVAHYLFRRHWRLAARLVWQLNISLTGADISPHARIGPGFVVLVPTSCIFAGCAGANLTIVYLAGVGGGLADTDIGAGPGMPLLGDDVTLDYDTMVLGPVRIGDRVTIEAGCTVTRDVPADARVLTHRVRLRRTMSGVDA